MALALSVLWRVVQATDLHRRDRLSIGRMLILISLCYGMGASGAEVDATPPSLSRRRDILHVPLRVASK